MKVDKYKFYSLVILCVVIFSSCSLQKRLYNNGYYISKKAYSKKSKEKTNTDTIPSLIGSIKPIKGKEVPKTLSADASNQIIEIKQAQTKPSILTDACDTLFLKNGAKILGKVSEVYPNEVKYKYCDSPDGPIRVINKADINYIVYANGYKEVVETKSIETHYEQPKKINGFAIAGFALSIINFALSHMFNVLPSPWYASTTTIIFTIFFSILVLLAIMLCVFSIRQIQKNRAYQKGRALAITGLVISIILLLTVLVMIIISAL
ncbi:MAG: hypothetical protein ACYDCN_03520 [Bacteroidia bacterium]